MNDADTKPLTPTVQVVLVPVAGRLGRRVERPRYLGPLVAGLPSSGDSLLHGFAQLFSKAIPIGHGGQRIARRFELGEIGDHPPARIVSVARAFVQSSSKVIHCVDQSTQSVWCKSIAVVIDRKQYLRDDRNMQHKIEANQPSPKATSERAA